MPWVVWGFFKLITPFIDPRTREKLKFNEDMTQFVPAEQLWTEYQAQGKLDFDYDHSEYWPALSKLCDEKRRERKERWIAGGKLVGESEIYLWGGEESSISASTGPADAAVSEGSEKAEIAPEQLKMENLKIEEKEVEAAKEENALPAEVKVAA